MKRIVTALTGASGVVLGITLLKALQACPEAETHLIISPVAAQIIGLETDLRVEQVLALADYGYAADDMAAAIASGSFPTNAMVVLPCSMKTLAAIAHGLADNLIARAADVTLKEGRKLILAPRETPLNLIHLENMLTAAKAGACIMPPIPAFYNRPKSIADLANHLAGRTMDQLGLPNNLSQRWGTAIK
jgi:4-hydroxy-3-polyprenylbenzoate decarboxylase